MSTKLNKSVGILFKTLLCLVTILNISFLLSKKDAKCETCVFAYDKSAKTNTLNFSEQESFWIAFLAKHPNYVPGLIHLSNLYIQNGNFKKASELLTQALFLSPNNNEAKSLIGVIKNR